MSLRQMKTGPAIGVALLRCAWAIPLKGQELVVNGGFDDGPFGWMSWQGSALPVSLDFANSSFPATGSPPSLAIFRPTPSDSATVGGCWQVLYLQPGQTYQLSIASAHGLFPGPGTFAKVLIGEFPPTNRSPYNEYTPGVTPLVLWEEYCAGPWNGPAESGCYVNTVFTATSPCMFLMLQAGSSTGQTFRVLFDSVSVTPEGGNICRVPVITEQPTSQVTCGGAAATFSVTVNVFLAVDPLHLGKKPGRRCVLERCPGGNLLDRQLHLLPASSRTERPWRKVARPHFCGVLRS